MSWKRNMIFVLFMLVLFQTAQAEEEHSSYSTEFLGKVLNFIVLFGGLAYILYRPLRNFLQARAQKIEFTIKESKDSWKEAERKLGQVRERLSRIEEEIAQIREEGRVNGQKEKEGIIEKTLQEAEQLKRYAREEIEMLTRAGVRELKEHAAELATSLARERIKRKMTSETAYGLIDKSIEKIESLYEKSDSGKEIHSGVS
jgi:F-type H+-transporting ATPase subunit b